MTIELLIVLFAGLSFGSFITLVSYRLPLGEDVILKPSRCPKCETRLKFLDLWPVLSWVMSGRSCRHCRAPISIRYPLTEIATAAVFWLIYARYGLTLQGGVLAMMAVALLIMIVADLEHYMIPDQVHYALLPLGLAWHYVMGTPWEEVAYGFVLGAGVGLALHHGYRFLRKKEGLGFGDVKFLAVAGLWLGVRPFVPFLFYSGLLGVATGLLWRVLKKGELFPFGPSLAISLFVCAAFPEFVKLFWHMAQFISIYN